MAILLCVLCAPAAAQHGESARADSAGTLSLEQVLEGYNAGISRAMAAIDTLRVEQEMVEPTEDEGAKGALAVLTYNREEGMNREESSSNLGHPVGEYSLKSLVGPELLPGEYEVLMGGMEEAEGRLCYLLDVTAVERDSDHFDGRVWVEDGSLGLVRITGEVADPPFPVRMIKLDKAFEPTPEGFWLLRRHTGEIDIKLGFVRRQGLMHIFYTDYDVVVSPRTGIDE